MNEDGKGWLCGAFQPVNDPSRAYRCTEPAGHGGLDHRTVIDGKVVARWPRTHPETS